MRPFATSFDEIDFDEIDEAEARRSAAEGPREIIIATGSAQPGFYIAAKKFARGDRKIFRKHMTARAPADGLSFAVPELLIARHEVGMYPCQLPPGEYRAEGHPAKAPCEGPRRRRQREDG
jgi:hypothetical protein